jgi:hypothetical protein
MNNSPCELTILMPCLNEAATVALCVQKAQKFLLSAGVNGEVLVADNGSTDGSQKLALAAGARVAQVPTRGYGAALREGIEQARGRYIIMGDADDSYDFSNLGVFLDRLREGFPLVMGNRFEGGILPGAMPPLHRYLGNPVLSFLGRLFFRVPVRDFHCGLRGFARAPIQALNLQTRGMEFASELVVKAALANYKIAEVPTTLAPDGRGRPPHLRSWRDGWRHLRFLLLLAPQWLYLYPGLVLLVLGLAGTLAILPGPLSLGPFTLDIHTMLYFGVAAGLGMQMCFASLFAGAFGRHLGIFPKGPIPDWALGLFTLERGLFLGILVFLTGLGGAAYSLIYWEATGFGNVDPSRLMRVAIPSSLLMTLGVEIALASFFLAFIEFIGHSRLNGDDQP